MLVVVNPNAANGTALKKWASLRGTVRGRVGAFDECVAPDLDALRACLKDAIARGERQFLAVGGDGTVNRLVNELVALLPGAALERVTLGAIGLGSSNDFHKWIGQNGRLGGVPCRLDFSHPVRHDVGRTTYVDETGTTRVRRWLINASVGTTATGNWIYNRANGMVGFLKRLSTSLGMVGAAVMALLTYRERRVSLVLEDGTAVDVGLRNLGVVKNPHFTGCLRYDSPYEPGSGEFFVHLLANTTMWDTLVTLARLARGRFAGRASARTWRARGLAIEAHDPFPVEGDGEIVIARRAKFDLEPYALQVCS